MEKEEKRNLDWMCVVIPEDCKAISVFADEKLFDEFVGVGLVPLNDPRMFETFGTGMGIQVFIGYEPGVDPAGPKGRDIVARLRAARSDGDRSNDYSAKNRTLNPSQEPDSEKR